MKDPDWCRQQPRTLYPNLLSGAASDQETLKWRPREDLAQGIPKSCLGPYGASWPCGPATRKTNSTRRCKAGSRNSKLSCPIVDFPQTISVQSHPIGLERSQRTCRQNGIVRSFGVDSFPSLLSLPESSSRLWPWRCASESHVFRQQSYTGTVHPHLTSGDLGT